MRVVSSLAVVLCFLLSTVPAQPQDVLTPVIASPLRPTAFAFQGTDHRQHLVYELTITNTGSAPATLQQIEVVDKDSPAKALAVFEGEALLVRLWTPGRALATTPQIEPNGTRLFLADFTLDGNSHVPHTLLHRFHLLASGPPGSPKDEAVPYTYTIAPIAVSTDIAVISPPLAGEDWVALNGCCEPTGAHRGTGLPVNGEIHYAQRFAIDWMQLDADRRFSHGDGKDVHDYADYGAKVIAVADGTVVETLSNLDDQPVGSLPDPKTITLENVDGNHIVLDLGHGRYAFYAHLQKNSLLVVKGQHVKRGQVLALLGNTGNSSAPHLHFHLMDGPSVLGSSGLPYVIDHFQVAGQLSREQFDKTGIDGEWNEGLDKTSSSRSQEFPLDLTVVDF
ncbi:peptidase M23 [Edaphobacter acidisoli]|uniref:Peptidase M23 n=1 Tax=Edaphobacter acidisoli TaxID=2040573 RepID=A0A916W6H7_9BACT|nr:M23 family metallopeptidase [Edaphobacter acidisoli]GGA72112.1 peptidase M23 [Edaphobacter acidisoli]